MPDYIKALILLLIAASVVLAVARDPLSSHYSKEEYRDFRNTWLFLTFCLFLSPGIWVFYALAFIMLLRRRYAADIDRVATYCFLVFAVPSIQTTIPGPFGIETLFRLDFQRMLAIVVLLPLLKKSFKDGLSVYPSDKYLLLYFVFSAALLFRGDNITSIMREVVTDFADVIIPYFVISRTIKSLQDLDRVLLAMLFSLSLISAEAVMEAIRHWELYNHTGHRLIGERIFRFSGDRAGILRARSIFMSPIILGYAMVLLLALLLYFKPSFNKKAGFYCLLGLAGAALIVCFSRGPWVGAVLALVTYSFIGSGFAKSMGVVLMGSVVGGLLLSLTEFGRSILNLLPFFGGTENADTFDYRAKLLENGMVLVERNPLFGDYNFLQTPEMEELRQGQGIIDTVNVYLTIAMYKGLIGLFLFLMIFFPTMFMIYRRVRSLPPSEHHLAQAGRTLLSFMAGALFIIATVSNADFVPIIYYMGAAFMACWIGLYQQYERHANSSREIALRQRTGPGYVDANHSTTAGI